MRHSLPKINLNKYKGSKKEQRDYVKYKSPIIMANDIQNYFDSLIGYDEDLEMDTILIPPSINGLAEHLKMHRSTLHRYGEKEEYKEIIADARGQIEKYLEESLNMGFAGATTIFNLKNNFGWKDKTEVDTNINTVAKLEDYFK
ncbi:MAG: terminase small subunit [Clostridium sp.]